MSIAGPAYAPKTPFFHGSFLPSSCPFCFPLEAISLGTQRNISLGTQRNSKSAPELLQSPTRPSSSFCPGNCFPREEAWPESLGQCPSTISHRLKRVHQQAPGSPVQTAAHHPHGRCHQVPARPHAARPTPSVRDTGAVATMAVPTPAWRLCHLHQVS